MLRGEMAPGGENVRLCILSPRPPILSFPRLTATAEHLGINRKLQVEDKDDEARVGLDA